MKALQKNKKIINDEISSVGGSYFYSLYLKRNIKYPPTELRDYSLYDKRQPLTKRLYKKILNTYFDVYFQKLYFVEDPRYFFLGGVMTKYIDRISLIIGPKKQKKVFTPIILQWLYKASFSHLLNIQLHKAPCSNITNRMNITKLDKAFKEYGDVGLVQTKKEFTKDVTENKKYLRHG